MCSTLSFLRKIPVPPVTVPENSRALHLTQETIPERARLVILEDNDAVIKIIIRGRSLAMRHLRKVQRVCYDWIFDVFKLPNIALRYVNTSSNLQICSRRLLSQALISPILRDYWRIVPRSVPSSNPTSQPCVYLS